MPPAYKYIFENAQVREPLEKELKKSRKQFKCIKELLNIDTDSYYKGSFVEVSPKYIKIKKGGLDGRSFLKLVSVVLKEMVKGNCVKYWEKTLWSSKKQDLRSFDFLEHRKLINIRLNFVREIYIYIDKVCKLNGEKMEKIEKTQRQNFDFCGFATVKNLHLIFIL